MIKLPIWNFNFLSWWTYKMPLFSCHNFKWKCTLAIQDFLGGKSGWVTSYIKLDVCLTQKKSNYLYHISSTFRTPFKSLQKEFLKKVELMTRNEIKSNFELFFFQTRLHSLFQHFQLKIMHTTSQQTNLVLRDLSIIDYLN